MTGLPDDPADLPTGLALERGPEPAADAADSAAPDGAPEPWYRNRVLLALWALMVALLLALVGYGIVELSRGGGATSGPAHSTSSSTPARSSDTSPATTPSTTAESPPPAETPEQTQEDAPPAHNSPAPAEPPHHRHHPHIPSTITLPHTVVTLPHGF